MEIHSKREFTHGERWRAVHIRDPKESHFCFQQRAWGVQALPGRGLVLFLPRPPGHTSTRHGQRMCKRKHPRPIQQQDPPAALGRVRPLGRLLAGSACFPPPPPTRTPGPSSAPRPSRPRGAGHRPHPPLSAAAQTSLLALLSPFRWLGGAMASPTSSFSFLGALGFPVCKPPSGLPRGLRSWRGREHRSHTSRQEGRTGGRLDRVRTRGTGRPLSP